MRPPLSQDRLELIDETRQGMLESLISLDRAVARVDQALKTSGVANHTLVIYLSDNGFFWGEHRLFGKGYAYEPSVRVPFAMRYPPVTEPGTTEAGLVANIDIVPTVYDALGLAPPDPVDGRSLFDLLEANGTWRQALLLEGGTGWAAAHTGDAVYIETPGETSELYDLEADPHQLDSLAGREEARPLEARLSALLEDRQAATGWPGALAEVLAEAR